MTLVPGYALSQHLSSRPTPTCTAVLLPGKQVVGHCLLMEIESTTSVLLCFNKQLLLLLNCLYFDP